MDHRISYSKPQTFKLHDRVQVSSEATGLRESPTGWIDHIEIFMQTIIVSVIYDRPTSDGRTGITLINLGMLTKI